MAELRKSIQTCRSMNPGISTKLLNHFILSFFLVLTFCSANAQSLQRQSVASGGSSSATDGIYISQTVGQCYSTAGGRTDKVSVHPGFQQSNIFSLQNVRIAVPVKIRLYPNPATYSVNIESAEPLEQVYIQVIDLTGRTVYEKNINSFTAGNIDCSEWPDGIYSLRITDATSRTTSAQLIIAK